MGDTPSDQRENDDLAQRQAALHLRTDRREAPQAAAAPGRGPLTGPPKGRLSTVLRPLFTAGALLVVVVLVGALALKAVDRLRPTPAAAASPQATLRLTPLSDGLKCVRRIAWSPDGKRIAVLGDTQSCAASALNSQTSAILIFDARNGEITERLTPDIDVLTALPARVIIAPPSATGTSLSTPDIPGALGSNWKDPHFEPRLTYSALVWTPDSKALLLPFAILTSATQKPVDARVGGLLREGVRTNALTTVWLDTIHASQAGKIEQWDLTGDTPTQVTAPAMAEAYRWNSDGTLAADPSAATGAVGAPCGGASFTVWQPGSLGYTAAPAGGSLSAQDVGWTAPVSPVSPDGRYFYESVSASGSLVPPSTVQLQPEEQTLAPHDMALQTLAQQLAQATNPDAATSLLVAWRPDGRLLAAFSPPSQEAAPTTLTVSIYDTTTGQLVKQLTPGSNIGSQSAPSADTLQWSPDGQQLLLADSADGAITIWGPGRLPA